MSETSMHEPLTSSAPNIQPGAERAAALQRMIGELLPFSNEDRRSLIETLTTFFDISLPKNSASVSGVPRPTMGTGPTFQFSEPSDELSAKEFMLVKSPKTDVERVACLAFYLARYRGISHFKTKDISAINTESAHRPFSNAADAVDNATKLGYLVPSVKGSKQLSAPGEKFVEALPDREAAKEILDRFTRRRNSPSTRKESSLAEKD